MFDRQQRGFVANYDAEGLRVGLKYVGDNGDDNPISDVQPCIDALKSKGPVYLVGYCYGGTIIWRAAARAKGVTAASSYYGAGVAASAASEVFVATSSCIAPPCRSTRPTSPTPAIAASSISGPTNARACARCKRTCSGRACERREKIV